MECELEDDPGHPGFGNYAALKLGIDSQRGLHAWATWLASRLRKYAGEHDGAD